MLLKCKQHVQRIPGLSHDTHRQPCMFQKELGFSMLFPVDSRCHFKSNEKAEYPTNQARYSPHYLQEKQSACPWSGSARKLQIRSHRLSRKSVWHKKHQRNLSTFEIHKKSIECQRLQNVKKSHQAQPRARWNCSIISSTLCLHQKHHPLSTDTKTRKPNSRTSKSPLEWLKIFWKSLTSRSLGAQQSTANILHSNTETNV